MQPLPIVNPGTPDTRSAARYLWWLTRCNLRPIALGVGYGTVSFGAQAAAPTVVGRAIDTVVAARDLTALAGWAGLLFALGTVQGVVGVVRHRYATFNRLSGSYHTIQLTVRHAARLGATLPRRLAGGDVVAIGTSDIQHIGLAMQTIVPGVSSLLVLIGVTALLLATAPTVGLAVVVGVPALIGVAGLLLRPLHHRQQRYRARDGVLTGRAGDIVAGLRVLRGVGGEVVFSAGYRAESQRLRRAGIEVARVGALLHGAQVALPGCFVVLITWLAGRAALAGQLTAGQLVSCFGYAVYLREPLRMLTLSLERFIQAHVAARRVVRLLSLRPELPDPPGTRPARPSSCRGALVDTASGLVVRPGLVTAVAATNPDDAVLVADRLGRYVDADVRLGGVGLARLPLAQVRACILVADQDARLFTGLLRDQLDPRGRATGAQLAAALWTASAQDVIDALPDGLDTPVDERGREFSGGQQQRLRLARALLADPPVLVLVEPTSAVDAHTEARIGARLGRHRTGRTTVICTTSPLLLDRADRVVFLDDGKVVAEGSHRELLDAVPRYAATVTREEDQ